MSVGNVVRAVCRKLRVRVNRNHINGLKAGGDRSGPRALPRLEYLGTHPRWEPRLRRVGHWVSGTAASLAWWGVHMFKRLLKTLWQGGAGSTIGCRFVGTTSKSAGRGGTSDYISCLRCHRVSNNSADKLSSYINIKWYQLGNGLDKFVLR